MELTSTRREDFPEGRVFQSPTYRGTQWNSTGWRRRPHPSSQLSVSYLPGNTVELIHTIRDGHGEFAFSPLLTGEHSGTRWTGLARHGSGCLSVPYLPGNTVEPIALARPLLIGMGDFQSPTYRGTQWNSRSRRLTVMALESFSPLLTGEHSGTTAALLSGHWTDTTFSPLLTGEHSGTPLPTGRCRDRVAFSPLLTGEHSGTPRRSAIPGFRLQLSVPYLPGNTVELRRVFAKNRGDSLSVPYLPGNTVERQPRTADAPADESFQSPTYRGTQWNEARPARRGGAPYPFQSPTYRGTQWNRTRPAGVPLGVLDFQSPTYRGTQWN